MTETVLEMMIGGIAAATAAAVEHMARAGVPVDVTRFDVDATVGSGGSAPHFEAGVTVQLAPRSPGIRIAGESQAS